MIDRETCLGFSEVQNTEIRTFDGGIVKVVDYMGGEKLLTRINSDIYGAMARAKSLNSTSLRWLGLCEVKLHIKTSINVALWWLRERSASVNEYSGRYSVMAEEFVEDGIASDEDNLLAFATYKQCLDSGAPKELARIVLTPDTFTYFYWKIDLQNLLSFINNGFTDVTAPKGVFKYLEAVLKLTNAWVPKIVDGWKNSSSCNFPKTVEMV